MALIPTQPTRQLALSLELSDRLGGSTRERCPDVVGTSIGRMGTEDIARIRTDTVSPCLSVDDETFTTIDADNALACVIDEDAWLRELFRVMYPGGMLHLTMPATGLLGWLDARNIYRYMTEILGRGNEPDSTLPTGWSRHYPESDLRELLEHNGFTVRAIERVGVGLAEWPQIAGLVAGNFMLGARTTERRLFPLRQRMEAFDQSFAVPKIGAALYALASKPGSAG